MKMQLRALLTVAAASILVVGCASGSPEGAGGDTRTDAVDVGASEDRTAAPVQQGIRALNAPAECNAAQWQIARDHAYANHHGGIYLSPNVTACQVSGSYIVYTYNYSA